MSGFKKILLLLLMMILFVNCMNVSFIAVADDNSNDVNKQEKYIRNVYINAVHREPTPDELSNAIKEFDNKSLDAASLAFDLLFSYNAQTFKMKNKEFVSLLYSILYNSDLDQEGQKYIDLLENKKTLFVGLFKQMVRTPRFFEVCDEYNVPYVQNWKYPHLLKVADLYEHHTATKLIKTNLEGWTIINYAFVFGIGTLIAILIVYIQYRRVYNIRNAK